METIAAKILSAVLYAILLLGIPLLLGLVDYEQNGQDQLKRNLNDMVRIKANKNEYKCFN